jgi:type IV secretion system protein VirB4
MTDARVQTPIPFKVAKREEDPKRFLPYARHVDSQVVALDNRDLMVTFELDGRAFETADPRDLNDWHTKLNGVWRNLQDPRLSVWVHLVRSEAHDYPGGQFRSRFARELDDAYRGLIGTKRLYLNRFFVTLLIRPDLGPAGKLSSLMRRMSKASGTVEVDDDALEILQDKAGDFEKLMQRCAPRRLGTYDHRGLTFSEPLEVLQLVMTGRYRRVPLIRGHLGNALYTFRAIFDSETLELRDADQSAFGGMFGIREYPATTVTGQLGALLNVDFPFTATQSFTFMSKATASERFKLKQRQMFVAEDDAVSQAELLSDAADDLLSNRFVLGTHHFTLAVYAPTRKRLRDNLSIARAALADAGLVAAREGAALEASYWSQLTGNFPWRARPAAITSRNFCALAPFHTYPAGHMAGNQWGDAIALLKTSASSPYYFNFHVGDLGHTLIIGPSGAGKTVLLNFLMAQAEKTGARQIFIDKDRGAEIFVRASGGTYLTLQDGRPTGFAPFRALDDTEGNRAFLAAFVRQLVRRDEEPLSVDDDRRIDEGVAAIMRLPVAQRSLGALRPLLGQRAEGGIGARLERWIQGGPLGWVFDNPGDELSMDARFLGFDMTDFLDNGEIRTPIMMYMFNRIDALLTGERMIISIDEFWRALDDPVFRAFAKDGLKTYRKRNALLVFATQSPADALNSEIARTIIEQVATRIMLPNAYGAENDYVEGLGLTQAEYRMIREELSPQSRRFLVKQNHDSVVVELDLDGLDDALAVLSGRTETIAVMARAIAEAGPDPDDWLPAFHRARRPS